MSDVPGMPGVDALLVPRAEDDLFEEDGVEEGITLEDFADMDDAELESRTHGAGASLPSAPAKVARRFRRSRRIVVDSSDE